MSVPLIELLKIASTVKNIKEQEKSLREKATEEARRRGQQKRKKPINKYRRKN